MSLVSHVAGRTLGDHRASRHRYRVQFGAVNRNEWIRWIDERGERQTERSPRQAVADPARRLQRRHLRTRLGISVIGALRPLWQKAHFFGDRRSGKPREMLVSPINLHSLAVVCRIIPGGRPFRGRRELARSPTTPKSSNTTRPPLVTCTVNLQPSPNFAYLAYRDARLVALATHAE